MFFEVSVSLEKDQRARRSNNSRFKKSRTATGMAVIAFWKVEAQAGFQFSLSGERV